MEFLSCVSNSHAHILNTRNTHIDNPKTPRCRAMYICSLAKTKDSNFNGFLFGGCCFIYQIERRADKGICVCIYVYWKMCACRLKSMSHVYLYRIGICMYVYLRLYAYNTLNLRLLPPPCRVRAHVLEYESISSQ